MRYIPIDYVEPGMNLAYDVFDSLGRNLVSSATELTGAYIEKLKNIGIEGLYINDELSEGIEIEELISPQLRAEGLQCVREQNVDRCKDISKKIVEEMIKKGTCSLDLTDLRTFDDYTYAHSVNVAILSCNIGLGLQMNEDDLVNLVLAGLLHDMGKLDIPSEILNKPSRLTQDEYMLMKTHAQLSYNYIKERIDISAQVKQAVLYHHENMDGSGYPSNISGENLSMTTRILHVADVYDALIAKRPYKQPFSPWEAVEYLQKNSGTMFDEDVVDTFTTCVPIYPKGTIVTLSNYAKAIVVDNTGKRNLRPLVHTFDKTAVDLSEENNKDLSIIIPEDDREISIEKSERERSQMIQQLQRYNIAFISDDTVAIDKFMNRLSYLYEIIPLKSGNQFLTYLKKHGEPDLLIIDAEVSGQDIYRVIEQIKELPNDYFPIIVLSEKSDVATVKLFRSLNIEKYILKPYRISYIKSEINDILFHENESTRIN